MKGNCECHCHCHCHENSCNQSCAHNNGCNNSCTTCSKNDAECSCEFLALADNAWMEVLKEKIKEQIISAKGKELDELAKIIAETNGARWKNKIEAEQACKNYQEKMEAFLGKCCG